MIIEILASIIGFFLLISLDHLFISLGFFSIWAFLIIYLYQKLHRSVIWATLLLVGISLGITVGIGGGTYILSGGVAIMFLFLAKKFFPDNYFFSRYIPYIFSYFIFYTLRMILGEFSNSNIFPQIGWSEILGFLLVSLISTLLVILIDRLYLQLRSNGVVLKRGIGIEIRRR